MGAMAQDPRVGDRCIDRNGKIRTVTFRDGDRVGYDIWASGTMGGCSHMSLLFWGTLYRDDGCRPLTAADVFAALDALVADFKEREGLGSFCALGCVEHMANALAGDK